jgi:hypothetical protein
VAKVSPLQSKFTGGEFSPLMYGRVDLERYREALATCENFIPVLQGGLTRRPGSIYVAEVKDSSKSTRLVEFEFSTTQAYILEFGENYIRFYKDYGQILSGTAYEVVTTYAEADLFQLKFTQSADVLYITHPSYPPKKLTRTGHTAWTLTTIDFLDGPYLPINSTSTTITPSGTSGSVTLTASAALFASTDVGRLIRIKHTNWAWLKVTAYTDTTHVTATVMGSAPTVASSSALWRLGLWSATTGYPAACCFHEDRLCFIGSTASPQRIDGSKSGDYENMAPTAFDGVVADDNAISFGLNANDVNVGRWITSEEKGLLAGTVAGEWVVKPSSAGEALSPTNVSAKQVTFYGSADITPVQAGKSTLFVTRTGRKIREMTYFFDVDGFRCPDLSQTSEHITGTGITQVAYQKEPQSILWAVRADGQLLGMTYERSLDSLEVGWHRHILGGESDAAGTAAKVESVAVIPSPDGTREDVWLIVRRRINGSTKRFIEYLSPLFEDTVEQEDAFFVDCGLTYDSPVTVTGITKANPAVVTAASHGFSNGDTVRFDEVLGMDEVNGLTFVVANKTANTFELQRPSGTNYNSTSNTAYVSGGEVRKLVSTISGLDHLEGQEVAILGDGAVQPAKTVASGAITLATRAAVVHVGLNYESRAQLLRIENGATDGTALGKTRRIHRVGFLLHRSLGLSIGTDFDTLKSIPFRTGRDDMSAAVPLFSGVLAEPIPAGYDFENQVAWEQNQPLPCTVLAVMPQMKTEDRG